jgi:CDP-glucose 4,6-dehydratase
MESKWTSDSLFWRQRPVAVTGGTGFLGSHLVSALLDLGAEVVVLVRDKPTRNSVRRSWAGRAAKVTGSVEDQAVVERMLGEYRVRTVFHLAAQTQVEVANANPVSTFVANMAGTWSVLEGCRRSPLVEQVAIASSDKAYGEQPVLPYTEEMELRAVHPYDVSKACADMLARSYAQTFGVPVVLTRCANFFGPGDTNWRRLVPGTMRALLEGSRPVIRSDGTATRDYLYIIDAVYAYLRLVEELAANPALAGEVFNFAVEQPISVLEVVRLIQDVLGSNLELDIQNTMRSEIPNQALLARKANNVLGWRARYSIRDALLETADWYRAELGYARV